jgi:hypothetical protein
MEQYSTAWRFCDDAPLLLIIEIKIPSHSIEWSLNGLLAQEKG